ncbi:MAG: alpha/beta fold hydrolase [Acidimicrobiales bacterium]|nr:alpha/beta fold hydrolase [Acidimicrobiales bacterium]
MLPALTALLVSVMVFACSSSGVSPPTTARTDPTTAITEAPEPLATTAPASTTELPAVPATSDQPEPTVAPAADIGIAAELVGRWEGVTRIVALGELPIAVAFELSGDELLAAMDIQGGIGLELVNVSLDGRHIRFELESPFGQAVWDGEVRDGVIDGEFTQVEARGIFRLERAGDPEPSRFRSEEVVFNNGEIVLAGELALPDGNGPHPAVVMISGSGDQTRNVDVAGFAVFAALAEELADIGIASLRYDDRGVGGSSGDGLQATIEDRAADVAAAVDLLISRDDIDAERIGLVGHSEGGMVAPLTASQSDSVAFVVLLAAPAMPGPELLETQLELLELAGTPPDQIEQYQAIQRLVFEAIAAGDGWDDVEVAIRALAHQRWRPGLGLSDFLCIRLWWFSSDVVGDAVAVVDGQGVEDGFPAVGAADQVGAVLASGGGDKVEDLEGGLFVGEVASMSHCSAEPGVEALDGVRGVDDPAQLGGELQERDELVPGLPPGADHGGVGVLPVLGERLEACLGGLDGGGRVDAAHGLGDRAPVLA